MALTDNGKFTIITIVSFLAFLIVFILLDPFETDREPLPPILVFTVVDGSNADDTHGRFFLIRAGVSVNINVQEYSFFTAKEGFIPEKLDNDVRTYDRGRNPSGGDRNGTYDWTVKGDRWSDGEYIGFDMPTENMDIEIGEGKVYEVLIKNPRGEVIFKDTFVYTCQG